MQSLYRREEEDEGKNKIMYKIVENNHSQFPTCLDYNYLFLEYLYASCISDLFILFLIAELSVRSYPLLQEHLHYN